MFKYISLIIIGGGFVLIVQGFIPEQYQLEPLTQTLLGILMLVLGAVELVSSELIPKMRGENDEATAIKEGD